MNIESSESVEKADSVRVEQRDTLREITTITIQTNDRGDTLKVTQVTDRERIRSKSDVSSKKDVVRTERDTVYIAVRDSVSSSKFQVSGDSLSHHTSTISHLLKWIFAVICAVGVLVIVVKLKIDNSYT